MPLRLDELAAFLGARLKGEGSVELSGLAELKTAGPSDLAFLSNPKYAPDLAYTEAGAVLLSEADAAKAPPSLKLLVSKNPYRDMALAAAKYFARRELPAEGVHPTAVVSVDAKIAPGCRVGAFCVVEKGASLGPRCVLHPFSFVGAYASLDEDCLLHPYAAVTEGSVLGKRVILQAGAVIGADGFGFAPDPPRGYVKIPQMGNVILEDDVEVQANACVDRGALGPTVVGRGTKIDNLVQVGHNVRIGRNTVLVSQTGISGSTVIGDWVTFAGQSAAAGHLRVGDQAVSTGQSGIGKDVASKAIVSGSPAVPMMEHHRGLAEMQRLPELKKRVKALEARLAELEKKLESR